MQHWIRDQNIRRFKAALSEVLSPERRTTIEALLAKELAENDCAQQNIPSASLEASSAKQTREHWIREAFPSARVVGDESR